ncbi:hypothetical protein OXX69_009447 [Metschnikowia pulcherrima]
MRAFAPIILAACAQAVSIPNVLRPRDDLDNTWFTCPSTNIETCGTETGSNTCCFESPGGIINQAQFWDYLPSSGSSENFTLAGIYPYACNGTAQEYCDESLFINSSSPGWIVGTEYGDTITLEDMETYWKNNKGSDEELWAEDFNKHGTCIRTNRPSCWGENFMTDEHIYTYYQIALNLYHEYPTFQFLSDAGIVPSLTTTYTSAQISEALSSNNDGHSVYYRCDDTDALVEVGYFHHFIGPLVVSDYVKIDSLFKTNCPSTGIRFVPKYQL